MVLKKFMSRKFLVLVIATVLVWFGKIDPLTWVAVAGIYVGVEGAIDILRR